MEKKKSVRPWIRSADRVPLCDSILKRVSRRWDADTWEAYLNWYQGRRHEERISSSLYEQICENRSEPIYQEYGHVPDEAQLEYCELLLSKLPEIEEKVLRLYFFKGKTELQISFQLPLTKSGVHVAKVRGLLRLARMAADEKVGKICIMKGVVSQKESNEPSIWDFPEGPICGVRPRAPDDWKLELQAIENANIRQAVTALSETQQKVLYLRYWCELAESEIASRLEIGINTVRDLCEVAVFKLKSLTMELAQLQQKEVQSCA
ncbi:MAG: sigma factor-like helix-turn-helix DNA-binding protein [Oligoflexia bacterium]|nr:sigma factor-like helix-turn-helix DNA-binding protein [Oligoflexia bacterium]